MLDLGIPDGFYNAAGVGINNNGRLPECRQEFDTSFRRHAFRWSAGVYQDMGTLGGTFSTTYGIDESGRLAGYAYTSTDIHAYRSTTGALLVDIDSLGATTAWDTESMRPATWWGRPTMPANNTTHFFGTARAICRIRHTWRQSEQRQRHQRFGHHRRRFVDDGQRLPGLYLSEWNDDQNRIANGVSHRSDRRQQSRTSDRQLQRRHLTATRFSGTVSTGCATSRLCSNQSRATAGPFCRRTTSTTWARSSAKVFITALSAPICSRPFQSQARWASWRRWTRVGRDATTAAWLNRVCGRQQKSVELGTEPRSASR